MNCSKCDGLMILQSFFDHFLNFNAWKCINCGRVVTKKEKTIESDAFSMFYQQQKCTKRSSQTPKLSMTHNDSLFLLVNGTYTTLEVALMHQGKIWQTATKHIFASTQLIPLIEKLCSEHNFTFNDITVYAVNCGPGPFTTLRTIIATMNGIGYATKTPLMSINGIEAWTRFEHTAEFTHTFALLNAFCNDVYYASYDAETKSISSGCCSISYWVENLKTFLHQHPHARIKTIGNGYTLHQATIAQELGAELINMSAHEAPPLDALIPTAKHQWQEQTNITSQLMPLYLKNYTPHKK